MKIFQRKSGVGFTLVEMLVTMFIFSLIFGAVSGLFVSAIQNQRRALAGQQLLGQTSYAMEYMGRALRMAKKDTDGSCTGVAKLNYVQTARGIKFENYLGQCQEFFRDCSSGTCKLRETKGMTTSDLTSSNMEVLSFGIGPSDSWDQNDLLQPRVTLYLEIRKTGSDPQPKIKIQTMISQRRMDVSE